MMMGSIFSKGTYYISGAKEKEFLHLSLYRICWAKRTDRRQI